MAALTKQQVDTVAREAESIRGELRGLVMLADSGIITLDGDPFVETAQASLTAAVVKLRAAGEDIWRAKTYLDRVSERLGDF